MATNYKKSSEITEKSNIDLNNDYATITNGTSSYRMQMQKIIDQPTLAPQPNPDMRQMFKTINAKEVAGVLILLMAFTITLYGIIAEPNGEIHSSVLEYNGFMLFSALGCFGFDSVTYWKSKNLNATNKPSTDNNPQANQA